MPKNCCNRNKFFAQNMMNLLPQGCGYDVDACAYFDAVVTNGGTDLLEATKIYWNDIIVQMKASGSFQLLDRLFALSNEHEIAALTSIVNPATATMAIAVNAPVFTPWVGFQFSGAGDYIDTAFNLLADGVNYTQDDCFFGHGFTNRVSEEPFGVIEPATSGAVCYPLVFGIDCYFMVNSFPYDSMASANEDEYIGVRTDAANFQIWQGAVSTNFVIASVPPPNDEFYIGATNQAGAGAFNILNGKWVGLGSGGFNIPQFKLDFSSQLL